MGPVLLRRDLARVRLSHWLLVELRRVDPSLPGMLIEETRVFGIGPRGPLLSSQIINFDQVGKSVISDELVRYELFGGPARLDEALARGLRPLLDELQAIQWTEADLSDWCIY